MQTTEVLALLHMCPECLALNDQDSTSPKHSGILRERQQTTDGSTMFRCKICRVYWEWRYEPAGWCKPHYGKVPDVVVDDDTVLPDDLFDSNWAPS